MTIEPFWAQTSEPTLRQGDLLPRVSCRSRRSASRWRMVPEKAWQSNTT